MKKVQFQGNEVQFQGNEKDSTLINFLYFFLHLLYRLARYRLHALH